MKITILITSPEHPINNTLNNWIKKNKNHKIDIVNTKKELIGGDILFLISCSEFISKSYRIKFKKTLIVHASDLPRGRGWSPHVWEIINGANNITLCLLEAEDKIDTGNIWKKAKISIPKTCLFDEINTLIFVAELKLMDFAIKNFKNIKAKKQEKFGSSYWPKRFPRDSEIDINKTISEQFDLIRVCDTKRFPAFFYKDGVRFNLKIEKVHE